MTIKYNQPINSISWLSMPKRGGHFKVSYEPQSVEELEELCRDFYLEGLDFDLIGHTSNTLYMPDYVCERVVLTRKINKYEVKKDTIECQCGVPVRSLSLKAIKLGIKGFEGLVDLPGTIGAALYGNAGCYGSSVSSLLVEAIILTSDGRVQKVTPEWFEYAKRSSVLKRGEKKGVILSVTLRREDGNPEELKAKADANHAKRRATQPEAKDSLGSIFANKGKPTLLNKILRHVSAPYAYILMFLGKDKKYIDEIRKHIIFTLLGARDIEPYVRTWNWYQWRDEHAHDLFWKYVRLHKLMYTRSDFEIEIKHNNKLKSL